MAMARNLEVFVVTSDKRCRLANSIVSETVPIQELSTFEALPQATAIQESNS